MHKRAFTLMEIILVIVILGALSGLALPRFLKTVETRKAEMAKQQIMLIAFNVEALKDQRVNLSDLCPITCDNDEINTELGMDIHNTDFDFSFQAVDSVKPSVAATRNHSSMTYSLVLWDTAQKIEDIQCVGSGSGAERGCHLIGMEFQGD